MLTLGLDTATDVCAVALLDGDRVLFEATLDVPRSHGRRLAPLVAQAFEHTDRTPADLGLVAVSAGPGSYTGLRIGMSTAKGLALATGADVVAVPTLRALAATPGLDGPVAVFLPSRRGEVYAAVYDRGEPVREPSALALDAVADWLPADLAGLGGPGADRLADVRPDLARLGLRPSAVVVARLGRQRLRVSGADDVAALEPLYLKPVATS
ncbi:tRNA (adenosine(37)-N6)-threonylcarbamoyltransferase complex dimerization subunit type 1 TsaB [Rubrivirga sp.]|uniref:tRNA (adenosine(37)-N6)-threonylcarbamoyltransferase complex dimerization subunit type 1 TsaB n=1 Tax=Rubrivirga sp. TaxID=1885344 RepID=UPI003B529741